MTIIGQCTSFNMEPWLTPNICINYDDIFGMVKELARSELHYLPESPSFSPKLQIYVDHMFIYSGTQLFFYISVIFSSAYSLPFRHKKKKLYVSYFCSNTSLVFIQQISGFLLTFLLSPTKINSCYNNEYRYDCWK